MISGGTLVMVRVEGSRLMNSRSSANQRRHCEIGGHTRFKRSRRCMHVNLTRGRAVRAPADVTRCGYVVFVHALGVGGFLSLNFARSTLGVVRIVNSANSNKPYAWPR